MNSDALIRRPAVESLAAAQADEALLRLQHAGSWIAAALITDWYVAYLHTLPSPYRET